MLAIFEKAKEKIYDYKVWLLMGLVILGIFVCYLTSHSTKETVPSSISSVLLGSSSASSHYVASTSSMVIIVDVKGAVKHPGVYNVTDKARVQTAITQAGGVLDNADMNQVNLAQKLTDGQVIYIPLKGEQSAPISSNNNASSIAKTSDVMVNLNTASLTELQTLDGIGAKKAEQIIAYREERGGFKSIEEIKEVSGIGEKRFEKLKDKVTI